MNPLNTMCLTPSLIFRAALAAVLALPFVGCDSQPAANQTGTGLQRVTFQTDWYAQAEHGGHYQALAQGYYQAEGIEVEIRVGGPGTNPIQLIAAGQVDLAMGRSDDVMVFHEQGVPLLIVGALMQKDPQGLLLHDENPVRDFKDLDGRSVMALPGANWVNFLKARYKIDFGIVPLNYGLASFMADKNFIQQCFVTNEPYYVRKNGANPRTMLLASSGYSPYRVIYTTKEFARKNPEAVRAFLRASFKGWEEFINGDSTPGKALIAQRNEKMTDDFMNFGIQEMRRLRLLHGDIDAGERLGLITYKRLREQIDLFLELGMLKRTQEVSDIASFDYLPDELRALTGAP